MRTGSVLLALIGATTAAIGQTKVPMPQPSRSEPSVLVTPFMAPTPTPQAPPTGAAPAPTPPNGLSPLLTQPGLLYQLPERARAAPPPSAVPGSIDQEKLQSYRNDLVNQRFQLDRQGVSPGNERYREIQRQLNQPGSR
jgi:hypothetical protein